MALKSLKVKIKGNKVIDSLLRIFLWPYFKVNMLKASKNTEKRKNGCYDEKYFWIKDLFNSHNNEMCFIVATGPSLTFEDLELLNSKKVFCFGMNSLIKIYNETNWRPNIYGIQDDYVYDSLKNEFNSLSNYENTLFVSTTNISKVNDTKIDFKQFFLNYLDHKMYHKNNYGKFKFSDDCYACIYDAYSITFTLMQLAVYMGFKTICLLGCDCNYNLSKAHFIESGHVDPKAQIMGDKMIYGHYEFEKYAKSKGVKVINCTRGGMLEVYERKALEEMI
ncbi:MAG: 6-hydroxymethylpterin diphosphokinase MptE-like protein [Anaeroplasma sp.]